MKLYKSTSVLLLAFTLTGCVNFYVLPPNTPKAKLHIEDQSSFFSNTSLLGIYKDASRCKNFEALGNLNFRRKGGSVDIPANKLVTILDNYIAPGYDSLDLVFSFYPKANQDYFIVVNTEKKSDFSNDMKVNLTVMQEISNNGKIDYVVTPIKKRKLITGFSSRANGDCEDVL